MVKTQRNNNRKKLNITRKIGGAKSQFMNIVDGANSKTKGAMTNVGDAVSYVAPSKEAVGSLALGTAAGVGTAAAVGIATGATQIGALAATTFIAGSAPYISVAAWLAPVGTSVGGVAGGGGAAMIAAALPFAGPIAAGVAAGLLLAYTTYSVARKNRIKKRVKHFLKKEMLHALDKMNEKSKQSKLSESKYPPLKHYDKFEANVKQFFIDYGVFDKLADIFLSFQSSMLHFYPSEKLMFPIQFKNVDKDSKETPNDDLKRIDLTQEPYVSYPVGSNFTCFYDYLTTKDYIYFTCDQMKSGGKTSFLRVKINSKRLTTKSTAEVISYFKKKLSYISHTSGSKPTSQDMFNLEHPEQQKNMGSQTVSEEGNQTGGSYLSDDDLSDDGLSDDGLSDDGLSDDDLSDYENQMGGGIFGNKDEHIKGIEILKIPEVDLLKMGDEDKKEVAEYEKDIVVEQLEINETSKKILFKFDKDGYIRENLLEDDIAYTRIRKNDKIIGIFVDGEPILDDTKKQKINDKNFNELNEQLSKLTGTVQIKIKRGLKEVGTFDDVPITEITITKDSSSNKFSDLGIRINKIDKRINKIDGFLFGKDGVSIEEVKKESIAYEVGFRKGDFILEVNGQKPESIEDFMRFYNEIPEGKDAIFKVKHKAKYTALQSTARGINYGTQSVAGFVVAPIIITGTAFFKLLNFTRWKIIDIMTVDDNNNKNYSRAISKENTIATEFTKNVLVLMQFPPFVEYIQTEVKKFQTAYLDDFQSKADSEDDAYIEFEDKEAAAKVAADVASEKEKQEIATERKNMLASIDESLKKTDEQTAQIKADSEAKVANSEARVAEAEQKVKTLEETNKMLSDQTKKGEQKADQSGGGLFGPSMYSRGNVIQSSKSKMFQGLRTRKFSEGEKKLFIEFVYYSTYAFYHVFSKELRVRESEMQKFFGDYIDDLMDMFKRHFSTIINSSSIYISIARALAITFKKKLDAAFKPSDKHLVLTKIDQNKESTLNETGAIEEEFKQDNLFSTDSFFNLKNKKIRDFIFKTYRNIKDLENAMDDAQLGNRQYKIASRLDYRFTVEILGKKPMQQGRVESHQVRTALNNIFSGNFGMFRNILDDIDKAIDEFDGVSITELQEKLQTRLPKLANLGRNGITFQFDEGLLKMGGEQKDLIEQQIAYKEEELNNLRKKQNTIRRIGVAED